MAEVKTSTALWDLPSNHDRLAAAVALDGKRVVDVGCGAGSLVRFLRSQGADAIGVECGDAMIAQAKAADPEHVDSYLDGVGQDLPLEDSSADVVIFSYSLHHVPVDDMAGAVDEAARVLRSGGQLVVLEPIAEGPGFETHRLIDDETVVRAHAQAALDSAPSTLTEDRVEGYTTGYSYADFAELKKTMVDISPERAGRFSEEVAAVTKARFDQLSVAGPGGHWFEQPVVMRIFTRE